jgi:DNA repair protein RecN (Recombination protein N)
VELHGQHDDRGLLNPRGHRAILDDYAGNDRAIAAVREAWTALGAARKAAAAAAAEREAIAAEEEFLRHAVAELDKLAPEAGEEATLDTRRRQMQGAEKIRRDVVNAYELLGQGGAETAMGDALRWLDGVADKAEGALEGPLAALNRAMVELDEAMSGVADAIDGMSFDPYELEACEERLFAIRGLARKHDVQPDELAGFADTLRAKLDALDAGEAAQEGLEKAVRDAQALYDERAEALTTKRRKAAVKLDKAVAAELAPLKMERAVFQTQLTDEPAGPEGRDAVSFTVATNPGAPAGPLGKIASGGELSRFLLALKVCLTQSQSGLTLIFDEIDRGVGGATADAVGRRLKALSAEGQVLVVTHSPQVAALGAHHWRVAKSVAKGMTTSTVTALAPEERVDEVARMLAGDTITDAARAAAEALLNGQQGATTS